jgi:hypothetical protein
MPLSIGNKWVYDSNEGYEIISIDTINTKKYYKFKTSCITNGKPAECFYWQRISNDTLFSLNYDSGANDYVEFVDAIFTLNENDVAEIHLPNRDKILLNESERLPSGNEYSIKVLSKKDDTIEFFTHRHGIDANQIVVYKKGIGIIKTKNDWGIEKKLTDYKLN